MQNLKSLLYLSDDSMNKTRAAAKRIFFGRGLFLLQCFMLISVVHAVAQVSHDSSVPEPHDTASLVRPPAPKPDSLRRDTTIHKVIHKMLPKKIDSVLPKPADTLKPVVGQHVQASGDMLLVFRTALGGNPYFNFLGKPLLPYAQVHQASSYSELFYFLVGILFYFGLIKLFFGKYLSNLFTLFFRVSMRQQQIREQVLQAPQPSLLLNILFLISGGLYASFLIRHFGYAPKTGIWSLLVYCAAILAVIYLAKFLLLKFSGWIFGIQRATDTYIFIVFLTNKMLGVFLLPFLVMMSFSGSLANDVLITLSVAMISIFYIYRFIVSFGPVRKEIKVNGFHFFLYLCAFEIAPLLLIYKLLLAYLGKF